MSSIRTALNSDYAKAHPELDFVIAAKGLELFLTMELNNHCGTICIANPTGLPIPKQEQFRRTLVPIEEFLSELIETHKAPEAAQSKGNQ